MLLATDGFWLNHACIFCPVICPVICLSFFACPAFVALLWLVSFNAGACRVSHLFFLPFPFADPPTPREEFAADVLAHLA